MPRSKRFSALQSQVDEKGFARKIDKVLSVLTHGLGGTLAVQFATPPPSNLPPTAYTHQTLYFAHPTLFYAHSFLLMLTHCRSGHFKKDGHQRNAVAHCCVPLARGIGGRHHRLLRLHEPHGCSVVAGWCAPFCAFCALHRHLHWFCDLYWFHYCLPQA